MHSSCVKPRNFYKYLTKISSKRSYKSGASKRAEKKRRIEVAHSNSRKIATFFHPSNPEESSEDVSNPVSTMVSSDCPIELNKNSTSVDQEQLDNVVEEHTEKERGSNSECESKISRDLDERNLAADAQFKLDLIKEYPTDRGYYPSKFSCTDLADQWGLSVQRCQWKDSNKFQFKLLSPICK